MAPETLPEQAVNAMNEVSGAHPGYRAAHAKGTLMAGTFAAGPDAGRLTRAPHMQGHPVRATVRFSNGTGDPGAPDYARVGRGMAMKLYLEDGSKTDMIGLTLPCFFVRTPEDFIEFTRAQKRLPDTGKPDREKLGAYVAAHPESQAALQAALAERPPASYATCAYNGIHSFRWINAEGQARNVRFRFEPEAGAEELSPEQARERGKNYLIDEITSREGIAFRLVVTLAEPEDPVDDPTAAWPDERETVEVGRLEISGPEPGREQGDDVLVFDPTRVVDGIELSDDPILRFRPRAYAVSVERRSGAPIPSGLT